ncbi:hypothetical protein OHQ88_10625 [Micromonospora zamorensis]|uniref:DUF7341 domain-containing protein n=1 Tax=Micromonospora zamorensis TaxID=709883 RepID=UPI002E21A3A4
MSSVTTLNIVDLADELTEPHQHVERFAVWDDNRNKKIRTHVTIQPGLLAQLHDSVSEPISEDGGVGTRRPPASRPPLALEALSKHTAIVIGVTRWCWSLRLDLRDTAESNIRAIVGKAPELDDDTRQTLLTELRQWRRWCAVLTGWENDLFAPRVPCPVCEKVGTLRVNLKAKAAFCNNMDCLAGWSDEDGSLYVLADHIRLSSERVAA